MESYFLNRVFELAYSTESNNNFQLMQYILDLVKTNPDIINSTDANGDTALMIVVRSGSYVADSLIKILIDMHSNINTQNKSGFTALMIASMYNKSPIPVQMLINYGANLNLQNANGYTALILACMFNEYPNAELLITSGADINIVDLDGRTALMTACICAKSDNVIPIIELLIKSGFNYVDNNGDDVSILTYKYAQQNLVSNIIDALSGHSHLEIQLEQLHI